jgi:transcriptional regulator with XRE-family HTH domain
MSQLGDYLKTLRSHSDRSRRWVERQSRRLYPEEEERWISHSYLRQLEEGIQNNPSLPKLRTLAQIYEVDLKKVLVHIGYYEDEVIVAPEPPAPGPAGTTSNASRLALAQELVAWLERRGLNPEELMLGVMGLDDESLQMVYRLLKTLGNRTALRPAAAEDEVRIQREVG